MTAKTKKQAPNFQTQVTVDQFADKVNAQYANVVHGANPAVAAERTRNNWRLLDPIETVQGPAAADRQARLSVALGKAGIIAGEVGSRQVRDWPVGAFRAGLSLDQAGAQIAAGSADNTTRQNLNKVVADAAEGGKHGRKDVEASFDALSAKAMLLHLRSRELAEDTKMEPWRRRGSEAILKASLGGLIKESVGGLRGLHDEYQGALKRGGNGSHLTGRMVETMYFTYRLMDWYKKEGTLASGYPRFALFREDKPLVTPVPPRSFDVAAIHTDQEPELVQVKTTSDSRYAPGITVWHPRQHGIIDDTTQVMDWFNTVVNNEASDTEIQGAWRNLATRFADPNEAARQQ